MMTSSAVVASSVDGVGNDQSKKNTEKKQNKNLSLVIVSNMLLQKDQPPKPKGDLPVNNASETLKNSSKGKKGKRRDISMELKSLDSLYKIPERTVALPSTISSRMSRNIWLLICFFGIMFSFILYGLLLEYVTSGGRKIHELSFVFITSILYTIVGAVGRHIRIEDTTQIPPARFVLLGLTSMGSSFCSLRSLRYVIYPIQVLAKACKPVPDIMMGAILRKSYPPSEYINFATIILGVVLFMDVGGDGGNHFDNELDSPSWIIGVLLLFVSLCLEGATDANKDKVMAGHEGGPFHLMYNIQLGQSILAGVCLVVFNQVHELWQMCQDMGFLLIVLGLCSALGQVFIFVTIDKFGALTCSTIELVRRVTTLITSIVVYGHILTSVQVTGLVTAIIAMILNLWSKGKMKKQSSIDPAKREEMEEEVKQLLWFDNENEDTERFPNDEEVP